MDKKLIEVKKILESKNSFDINKKIKELKETFKTELKEFKYIDDKKLILTLKNKYIRYISFSNKINYGGFLYKTELINGKLFIYLINKYKKLWKIDFDQYYIFYNNIIKNENDVKRNIFEIFIKNYEENN